MKELVDKFLEAEEKNFSLFNYVNELNNEIEQLEGTITETKLEIEIYYAIKYYIMQLNKTKI